MGISVRETLTVAFVAICVLAYCSSQEERLLDLENLACCPPKCNLDDPLPDGSPEGIKTKYNLNNDELALDLRALALKYGINETNELHRMARRAAVSWLGEYGGTNDLCFLKTVMYSAEDFAQQDAIGASVDILRHSPDIVSLLRSVVTNGVLFARGKREWTYCLLEAMCCDVGGDDYIDNNEQRQLLCAFILERASLERDVPLCVDRRACRMVPSYRHSQQRRDNLAAARPPNLTGKPAELYDAAQNDAAQSD